jgi:phosphoglycolate phosphatase-like HAD superfamily hydrolase
MIQELKDADFEIAVCGNMDDLDRGDLDAAKNLLQTRSFELCANDNTRSNVAMLMLLMDRHKVTPEETIVVSDMPRDKAAAEHHGCELSLPGVFKRHFQLTDGFQHLVKG